MKCIAFDTNLNGKKTSQYRNYIFNSMVKFNGTYLGANGLGLFKLEGDRDDDAIITAEFEPITSDLGIVNLKRMHYVYVGLETDENLLLTITADDKPVKTRVLTARKEGQQRITAKVGYGLKGRYWSFKISNPNGNNFAVDSIHVLPQVRHQSHV